MKQALIVSPHFPPINAPDHQRVRMALPFFREFGWKATVLAVKPEQVEGGARDDLSEHTLPAEINVIRTDAVSFEKTRRLGLGSLAIRAYPFLQRVGDQLLKREKFDVVFFSTTAFPVMALGRRWHRKSQLQYVLDFQDPWRSDYYERTGVRPPGGRFKYAFAKLQARMLEPYALRRAAHIVSVSPAYPKMLLGRYPQLRPDQISVLPFGAAETDFEYLRITPTTQSTFSKNDGKSHWVYVGRAGDDMRFALRSFFLALKTAALRYPDLHRCVRLHFVGTDYAPPDRARKTVEPIAIECGVGDMVTEQTARIPYFEALQCLLDADALMVFGSDDPSYTASKIYPYILASKTLLAVFHEQSSVVSLLKTTNAGTVISFRNDETTEKIAERILNSGWFPDGVRTISSQSSSDRPSAEIPLTNWNAFEPFTAREMTRKLCKIFDNSVGKK